MLVHSAQSIAGDDLTDFFARLETEQSIFSVVP